MIRLMNKFLRSRIIAPALVGAAVIAAGVLFPRTAQADGRGKGDEAVVGDVRLDDVPAAERKRIRAALARLVRIRSTVGDPSKGEAARYVDAVDGLARFLKRGSVEEVRRLSAEAENALRMVDRKWIDRTFQAVRETDGPNAPAVDAGKFEEQKGALRRVGNLIRRAQDLPARQKRLETEAERSYRNLVRLKEEAHRTIESIGVAAVKAQVAWMVVEIDRTVDGEVRPIHDRQVRLVALHRRILGRSGAGKAEKVVRLFREYSSKLKVIARATGDRGGDHPSDSR